MQGNSVSGKRKRSWRLRLVFFAALSIAAWTLVVLCLRNPLLGAAPELEIYLLAAAFLGFLLMFRLAADRMEPALPAFPAAGDALRGEASPMAAEPGSTLDVLGVWAVCGAGSDAVGYTASLYSRQARPAPDLRMREVDGYDVYTNRVTGLDTTNLAARLQEEEDGAAAGAHIPRDALLRSLSLLDRLMQPMLAEWPLACNSLIPPVRVIVALPAAYTDAEHAAAERFLTARLEPLRRRHVLEVECISSATGFAALERLQAFQLRSAGFDDAEQNAEQAAAVLMIACDSSICDSVISGWRDSMRLFDRRRPDGLMAGEGAFAILCANRAASNGAPSTPVLCRIAETRLTQRTDSADAAGKVTHAALEQAIAESLEAAGLAPENVAGTASDADHRLSRALESLAATASQLPHLNDIRQCLASNEACGHLGAASAIAALVAAATQASLLARPIVCLSLADPMQRAATVFLPPHPDSLVPRAAPATSHET